MKISIVVAAASNRVIGNDGGLIWRMSDDLRYFKRVTIGKPVLMGRKTFASIGKPLTGRTNVVISRTSSAIDGVKIANSFEEGLALAREAAKATHADEICVIGGGEIYEQAMPIADRIFFTRIDAVVAGDVVFPKIDSGDWAGAVTGSIKRSERNEYDARHLVFDRKALASSLTLR
ncbi:MAG: dihydrofolate reductase [Parvularculaceae bacterium]